MVSAVLSFTVGEQSLELFAPPYGAITQEDLAEAREWLVAETLEPNQQRDMDWYLLETACRPWRYGLSRYARDWEPGG